MNSVMSSLIIASSLPNMNSASARGQLRLADAGRAEEDERRRSGACGSFRPARARRTAFAIAHDRLVLADDAARAAPPPSGAAAADSSLGDARDRDAGPHRHDLGDVLLGDRRAARRTRACHLGAQLVDALLAAASPRGRELGGVLVLLGVDRRVLLLAQALEAASRLAAGARRR